MTAVNSPNLEQELYYSAEEIVDLKRAWQREKIKGLWKINKEISLSAIISTPGYSIKARLHVARAHFKAILLNFGLNRLPKSKRKNIYKAAEIMIDAKRQYETEQIAATLRVFTLAQTRFKKIIFRKY